MKVNLMKWVLGCCALVISASASAEGLVGQTVYTQANIWFEKPTKIPSTNYHVGGMLTAGTKVTVDEVSEDEVSFTDAGGTKYRINVVIKHNNVPGPQLAERLFAAQDPMAEGGKFSKFSKEEQEQIRSGSIAKGMSKDAVLMAYGYPPTIRTPSTNDANWTYWKNRWVTRIVRFDDSGKVAEIQG